MNEQVPPQQIDPSAIENLFGFHKLNSEGQEKAKVIAQAFEVLAYNLIDKVQDPRCWALVKTKLEEACFYAKKGMALRAENQELSNG